MKAETVKLRPEHIKALIGQKSTAYLLPLMSEAHLAALANNQYSQAVVVGETVIGCVGVSEYWPGRAEVWAFINENTREHFLAFHNVARKLVRENPIKRLEAAVEVGFEAGHRWIKSLGFGLEAECLKAFYPNGADCSMYARIRKD